MIQTGLLLKQMKTTKTLIGKDCALLRISKSVTTDFIFFFIFSNNIVGETSLDRLACGIGGKTVFGIAINIISQMLQNVDWKQRYAALMAISALGEGCHKQMLPMLDQIVSVIIPFVGDSHCRVRYAVCNALGQMATDFSPNFEEMFHEKFIPNLLMVSYTLRDL